MLLIVFMALSSFATAAPKAENNVDFSVSIKEGLTVSVTTPESWASGSLSYNSTLGRWVSPFLVNPVNISVTSNNTNGFTASMTSSSTSDASLANTAGALVTTDTIPTLANATTWTRSNTSNTLFWGYSLDDGNETGTYRGIPLKGTTPVTVLSSENQSSGSRTIYFGAKADSTIASGTYAGTVIISVVSDIVTTPEDDNPNDNPVIPVNPATPAEPNTPTYDSTNNRTVYTTINNDATNHTETTTTIVSDGDTRNIYANPQGVTRINEGTPLATGLAATTGAAVTTGIFFFIIAKRRKDEEEEEDQ